MKNLESLVYESDAQRKTLEHLLETLDFIKPVYVSRIDYDSKKGKILAKIGNDKFQGFYNLYLPEDLKVGELASIIRRINKFTFGDGELPIYSSFEELQDKIVYTFGYLIDKLSKTTNEEDKKEVEKALKKYYLLYADLFPGEENKLNDSEYRKKVLETQNQGKQREYEANLTKVKTKAGLFQLNDELAEIESQFSDDLINHLSESFFESAVNDLRYGLEIVTSVEQEEIIKYCEDPRNGFKKIDGNYIRIVKGKTEEIDIRNRNLGDETKKLRDKIGIDRLKQELQELRKIGNQEQIIKKELEVTNKVAKDVYNNFYYYLDSEINGYQIKQVLKTKKIQCVGFSIIGHAFLNELGINHKGLNIPGHSALEINIGGKDYILDLTSWGELKEIERRGKKVGIYEEIYLKNHGYYNLAYAGDPESILVSAILMNKGGTLDESTKYMEAIEIYDKAIQINPNSKGTYFNKGNTLKNLGRHEEAIEMYKKSIELLPKDYESYFNIGYCLRKLGRYEEAIEIYDKIIRINPNKTLAYLAYNYKGRTLIELGKFEEAIDMFDKAIQINPNDSTAYINKGILLNALGKFEDEINVYKKGIQVNPNGKEFYNGLAYSFYKIGKISEAFESIDFAIKLDPKDENLYDSKGELLGMSKKSKPSKLYYYASYILKGKEKENDNLYPQEKQKIRELITSKDFEGLRLYLLELEKQEK